MRNLVLYFFLLVLGIVFNLTPNAIYKYGRFFKAFPEKSLKLVLSGRDNSVMFDLSLMLLPAKDDPISEKRGYK